MPDEEPTADFASRITTAYAAEGPVVEVGRGVLDGTTHPDAVVQIPAAMMNRHGLIAGATGTGKTVTLQAWPSTCRPSACRCSRRT